MTTASVTPAAMPQAPLLDIRSLWRIPAPISKKGTTAGTLVSAAPTAAGIADPRPRARLSKVLGIQRSDEINDLSPTDFWQVWSSASTQNAGPSEAATASATASDETVVAIIGDLLRDKVEDKSLPWYTSLFSLRLRGQCLFFFVVEFHPRLDSRDYDYPYFSQRVGNFAARGLD